MSKNKNKKDDNYIYGDINDIFKKAFEREEKKINKYRKKKWTKDVNVAINWKRL